MKPKETNTLSTKDPTDSIDNKSHANAVVNKISNQANTPKCTMPKPMTRSMTRATKTDPNKENTIQNSPSSGAYYTAQQSVTTSKRKIGLAEKFKERKRQKLASIPEEGSILAVTCTPDFDLITKTPESEKLNEGKEALKQKILLPYFPGATEHSDDNVIALKPKDLLTDEPIEKFLLQQSTKSLMSEIPVDKFYGSGTTTKKAPIASSAQPNKKKPATATNAGHFDESFSKTPGFTGLTEPQIRKGLEQLSPCEKQPDTGENEDLTQSPTTKQSCQVPKEGFLFNLGLSPSNLRAPEMSSGRKKQAIAKDKDLFENAPPAKKLKKLNTAETDYSPILTRGQRKAKEAQQEKMQKDDGKINQVEAKAAEGKLKKMPRIMKVECMKPGKNATGSKQSCKSSSSLNNDKLPTVSNNESNVKVIEGNQLMKPEVSMNSKSGNSLANSNCKEVVETEEVIIVTLDSESATNVQLEPEVSEESVETEGVNDNAVEAAVKEYCEKYFPNEQLQPGQLHFIGELLNLQNDWLIAKDLQSDMIAEYLIAALMDPEGFTVVFCKSALHIQSMLKQLQSKDVKGAHDINSKKKLLTLSNNKELLQETKIIFCLIDIFVQIDGGEPSYTHRFLLENSRLINRIVIEDSQCGSEMTNQYSKLFRTLAQELMEPTFKDVQMVVVTPTCDIEVRKDIIHSVISRPEALSSANSDIIKTFNESIIHEIMLKNPRCWVDDLNKYITNSQLPLQGIIYCWSDTDAQQVAKFLRDKGLKVEAYNKKSIKRWLLNEFEFICVTKGFDLHNICKPETNIVIHFGIPSSFDELQQRCLKLRSGGPKKSLIMYDNNTEPNEMRSSDEGEANRNGFAKFFCLKKYKKLSV